jgi:hypothetical protein
MDLGANALTIATFNYDRSLEYFLFNALSASYGMTADKARSLLARIPIIHLHGQLGALPELTGGGRPFSPQRDTETIRMAARGITIIHEADDGDQTFVGVRDLINTAEIVCFLGFGYHRTNIRRLGIAQRRGPKLCGTVMGMEPPEIAQLTEQHLGREFHVVGYEILDFLRKTGVLIGHISP